MSQSGAQSYFAPIFDRPLVVQVDRLGQAQVIAPAEDGYCAADPQVAWHLARFIEQVRSIPADPIVPRQAWLRAYD